MKKNKLIYFAIGLIFTISSCAEWLNVEPRQSIDSATALNTQEAITAASNGVYARLRAVALYGRDFFAVPELLADNAFNTGAGNRLVGQFNNQPGAHMNNWGDAFFGANQINLILRALEEVELPVEFRNRIRGEMLFLRALLHHDMARVYAYDPTADIPGFNLGGIPILETGTLTVAEVQFPSRASVQKVYDFIYRDLEESSGLLQNFGNARRPHFITIGAVNALFSRVALYRGDYQRALAQAQLAMSSGGGATFPADPVSGWRSQVHPESFFEIVFTVPDNIGGNESLRATFMSRVFLNDNVHAPHGNAVLSQELVNVFSPEDRRRALQQRGLAVNSALTEINKFASKNGVPNLDNVPVIRYAEAITNKAEAHYHLGQFEEALTELNRLRTRAGLTPLEGITGSQVLEEILLEKRREFAFEGHRFFDLKRLGRNIVKPTGTIEHSDFRILGNIPNREIETNPNLVQNRGY